jgi:hypothetical protein
MKLLTKFDLTPQRQEKPEIQKLFQVVFIGDVNKRLCRAIDVYTCIITSWPHTTEGKAPSLEVDISLHSEDLNHAIDSETFTSRNDFFKEVAILDQFWDKVKRHDTDSIIGTCDSSVNSFVDFPLLEIVDAKPPILVTSPSPTRKIKPTTAALADGIRFDFSTFPPFSKIPGYNLSVGQWLHQKFVINVVGERSSVNFEHEIIGLENVTLSEIRLYYCLPSSMEISNPRGDMIDKDGTQSHTCEIVEVFSQSSTIYFDPWVQHQIKSGTLYRLHNRPLIDSKLRQQEAAKIELAFRARDENLIRRYEFVGMLAAIVGAGIASVGIDATRLAPSASFFPPIITVFSPLAWWLLTSLMVWISCAGYVCNRASNQQYANGLSKKWHDGVFEGAAIVVFTAWFCRAFCANLTYDIPFLKAWHFLIFANVISIIAIVLQGRRGLIPAILYRIY